MQFVAMSHPAAEERCPWRQG